MQTFETVCETCPLRPKIDVSRAYVYQTGQQRRDGRFITANDGDVTTIADIDLIQSERLPQEPLYDAITRLTEDCSGPTELTGVTRRILGTIKLVCGVELAQSEPKDLSPEPMPLFIPSPETVYAALGETGTDFYAQFPHRPELPFHLLAAAMATSRLVGNHAAVAEGRTLSLERSNWESEEDENLQDLYRINVTDGPSFVFQALGSFIKRDDDRTILATGLSNYLNADITAFHRSSEIQELIIEGNKRGVEASRNYFLNKYSANTTVWLPTTDDSTGTA